MTAPTSDGPLVPATSATPTGTDPAAGFGPLVDAHWLTAHIDEVVVCDVRWYLDGRSGAAAHAAGHIPGAVFVDLDTDLADPPAAPGGRHPLPSPTRFAAAMGALGIGDDTRVVVYDDAAGSVAARMWWMLDSIGIAVAVLDGGIGAWTGPLDTGPVAAAPVVFTPRPWPPTRFVDADGVAARPVSAVLIDARAATRFRGEPNPIDARPGHIPGARSRPFADNVHDDRLRSADELRVDFAALGVGADTVVIASCGSGVTACHDLLALRVAGSGDQASLYVGSWSDWSADPERPIETGDPTA